jgi:hypothetical protein
VPILFKTFAALLAWACFPSNSWAADRGVQLITPKPLMTDIAAMPQIQNPVDDAERRINAATTHLNQNVIQAAKDCKGGDWSRTIEAPMTGPGFLSLVVTDSYFCGGAHPDGSTWSIVYDLTTGRPVDWTHLLPSGLIGRQTLEDQSDGTKIVTLASKQLFDLYMDGYRKGEKVDGDLQECKDAILQTASEGPPELMVWLDAKGRGLAVQIPLAHVVAACEDEVVIPADVLKARGAQPTLLKAFSAH